MQYASETEIDNRLTCRARHVKCDEQKPECGNCSRARRDCVQSSRSGLEIRAYRGPGSGPEARLHTTRPSPGERGGLLEERCAQEEDVDAGQAQWLSPASNGSPALTPAALYGASVPINSLLQPESVSPLGSSPGIWIGNNSTSPQASVSGYTVLSSGEARLVHHYAVQLGRWLDCTDGSRQFSLKVPALVSSSPILLRAVISFSARHVGDTATADAAHEECIHMLISLLDSDTVAQDDVLLCAIVILRVYEQLSAVRTGSDQERHLAGCSALLRASQGSTLDLTAPTLREAAFWVYMRQCLYNACVNQQPPDVDFSLTLLPTPPNTRPFGDLPSETAWANMMTWICATVVQFCFGPPAGGGIGNAPHDLSARLCKWEELKATVDGWAASRPRSFDPILEGEAGHGDNPFPELLFTADWHVIAFGFYHLACMLLIIYKPVPRFAIRNIHSAALKGTDSQIMQHARQLCGSCWTSPQTVPARITLCHTVFIWGALMTDPAERQGLARLLCDLERDHSWPTAWIISFLHEEWGAE